jgi:hypothetical protein
MRHVQLNGKIAKKIDFFDKKIGFFYRKIIVFGKKIDFLTRKQLFHVHNLSTRSNFFAKFFQSQNRDFPFPFEDVPSPVLIWGSPYGTGDSIFSNTRMETGILHFHMGMCQSPFP